MLSLAEDLQNPKKELSDFKEITNRILSYLPNVITGTIEAKNYIIYKSAAGQTTKLTRPVNENLFIHDVTSFSNSYTDFLSILEQSKNRQSVTTEKRLVILRVLYTIQQAIGLGCDLLLNDNSARKHVGNRFEELIRCLFEQLGYANNRTVLKIPYQEGDKKAYYKCENDAILSPYKKIKSNSHSIDPNEVVVSIKTTSKDRMGKIFIDKILLEKFVNHPIKSIGIFHNDIQRKKDTGVTGTLVSGLFMVYHNFLTNVDGVYYIDVPPIAEKEPYSNLIKPISDLICDDIHILVNKTAINN